MALKNEELFETIARKQRDQATADALDALVEVAFGKRVRHQIHHCGDFGRYEEFACTDRTNINIGFKVFDLLKIRAFSLHEVGHCLFTRSYQIPTPLGMDNQDRMYLQNSLEDGRIENLVSRLGGPVCKNFLMWLAINELHQQFKAGSVGANKVNFLGWYAAVFGRVNVPNWLKAKLRKFYLSKGIPAALLTKIEKIVKRYLFAKTQAERDEATFSLVRAVRSAYPRVSNPTPELPPKATKPQAKKGEPEAEEQPQVNSDPSNNDDEGVEADTEEDLEGQIGEMNSDEPKPKDEKKDEGKAEKPEQAEPDKSGVEDEDDEADSDGGDAESKDEDKDEAEGDAEGSGAGADKSDEEEEKDGSGSGDSDTDEEGEGSDEAEGEAEGSGDGVADGSGKSDDKAEDKTEAEVEEANGGASGKGNSGCKGSDKKEVSPEKDLQNALKEIAEAVSEAVEADVDRLRQAVRGAKGKLDDGVCNCESLPISDEMSATTNQLYRRLRDVEIEARKSVRGYAGRLNTTTVMNKLAQGQGVLRDTKIFSRMSTNDRGGKLRVYVKIDKSGSMLTSVVRGVSQFAWELQQAVLRTGGECVVRAFDTGDYEISNERGVCHSPSPSGDTELAPSAESIIAFFRQAEEGEGKLLIVLTDCGVADLNEVGVMMTDLKRMGVVVWIGSVPADYSALIWSDQIKEACGDFANVEVIRDLVDEGTTLFSSTPDTGYVYGGSRRGNYPLVSKRIHDRVMEAFNKFLRDFAAKVAAANR